MTVHDAYEKAREVLAGLGVSRIPISVSKVAKGLGLIVEYTPLDDELSGMAFTKDGQNFILVNSLHHTNRQRFSIAHEIGHHMLHAEQLAAGVHVDKGILRRDAVSSEGTLEVEKEANAFASELLMPSSEISAALGNDFDLDDSDKVEKLARKFQVSMAAMQFRLMRL